MEQSPGHKHTRDLSNIYGGKSQEPEQLDVASRSEEEKSFLRCHFPSFVLLFLLIPGCIWVWNIGWDMRGPVFIKLYVRICIGIILYRFLWRSDSIIRGVCMISIAALGISRVLGGRAVGMNLFWHLFFVSFIAILLLMPISGSEGSRRKGRRGFFDGGFGSSGGCGGFGSGDGGGCGSGGCGGCGGGN